VKLTFQRGGEELTLELCHEIATSEFVVVSRLPDGGTTSERFGDQDEALAYLQFLEVRLRTEQWHLDDAGRRDVFRTAPGNVLKMRPVPASPDDVNASDDQYTGTYGLERPLCCPHCREWIRSVLVVRLIREQVPFTSTLPRAGRALACSACEGILSVELSRI
jgi:hypothetical protein